MPAWKPGQSGNPNGRPKKGQTIRDVIRGKIDKDKLAEVLLKLAYEGNDKALRMILQYHDGLPAQMAPDDNQVNPQPTVILLPSNGREFQEPVDEGDDDPDG